MQGIVSFTAAPTDGLAENHLVHHSEGVASFAHAVFLLFVSQDLARILVEARLAGFQAVEPKSFIVCPPNE